MRQKIDYFKNINLSNKNERYLQILEYELDYLIEHYNLHGFLLAPVGAFEGIQGLLPAYFSENNTFRYLLSSNNYQCIKSLK